MEILGACTHRKGNGIISTIVLEYVERSKTYVRKVTFKYCQGHINDVDLVGSYSVSDENHLQSVY